MGCKGGCTKYKITKPPRNEDGRYHSGQKRCTTCEMYIKWDGVYCPCCKSMLRYKPRNSKNRHKLQKIMMIKRI